MSDSILVTGASGFVGGKVLQRLISDEVRAFGVGRRKLNLNNYQSLDLTKTPPTIDDNFRAVIHAAARSSPWGSRREFAKQNIDVTRRLLEACESAGSPRFVFISSSSVFYRSEHQYNMTEQTPHADPPTNHYAWSKQQAESLVRQYAGPWVIIRPRAVFGPSDTVLFPRILAAASAGKLPILVNRGEPAVGDLVYIDNLVDVIVKSATDDSISGDYNVTNNEPVEIVATLLNIFERLDIPTPKRKVPVARAMKAASVIELFYKCMLPFREPPITRFGVQVFAYSKTFDVQKMLNTFGPPRVNFEEGIEQFASWIRDEKPYEI